MLNLDAEREALEPWWFIVQAATASAPAVRVEFEPIRRIALRAARRAAGAVWQAETRDDENAPIPNELIESAGDALSESLLMSGIRAWEGVGDRDGNPAPVTPDNLRLFLADPLRFEKLDAAYVRPFVLKELEKNASSPLPNGISVGATQEKVTANRSARLSAKAGVKRSRKKAAKPAPTLKTNSAQTQD